MPCARPFARAAHRTRTATSCQPDAPSGAGGATSAVWVRPSASVARTVSRCSPASRPTRTTTAATCPGRRWRRASRRATGRRPRAPRRPRRPCAGPTPRPRRRRPRVHGRTVARRVDARRELDRPALRPPARGPVGDVVGERRDRELGDPLRRGHVAVQPGHDKPGGEPVLGRQRLAVHPDGEQARPVGVGEGVERRARRPPVGARGQHHVRAVLHARAREQLAHRVPEPPRVAHEVPADLVGHAREREVVLDEREREQLVERDLERVVDEPGDAQRPRRWVDLGHAQRRVDAVEVRVRGDVRREPGDAQVRPGGDGGGRGRGGGQPQRVARCRHGSRAGGHRARRRERDDARRRGQSRDEEEPAAVEAAGRRRRVVGAGERGRAAQRPERRAQQQHGDPHADQARQRPGHVPARPGGGDDRPDRPDGGEQQRAGRRTAQLSQPAAQGRARGEHDAHDPEQHRLVRGAEGRHGPVLERPRHRVDDARPGGEQRARPGRDHRGDELGDGEPDGRRDDARERRPSARVPCCLPLPRHARPPVVQ